MDLSVTKAQALRGLPLKDCPYHSELPDPLKFWYVYVEDVGHSVLALMDEHLDTALLTGRPEDWMIPFPVKTILRRYLLVDGMVVCNSGYVCYTPKLGLECPEEDYEY